MQSGDLRIVSLLPSATEIVCALGAGQALVGISHECDFPQEFTNRPVLTRARIDAHASSGAIDAAVRGVLQSALSIYAVDDQRLCQLAPDVIITQDLCQVCAVSLDDVRAAVARLAQRDQVRIVCLRPTHFAEVLTDIDQVAAAIDRRAAGSALCAALKERIGDIALRAKSAASKPRVASIEWLDPLMLGGTWMPELIDLAGGMPVGAQAGKPAPTVQPRQLAELRPDVVVVKPCGFPLARTIMERELLERSIVQWVDRKARVYVTDGNAFFNRPGPRLVESLEIMAACVHPELFTDFAEKHRSVLLELGDGSR
jgi:iron complex transport system substrate-binding protein